MSTMGPVYNEDPATTSRFLCIKIIECNVKKFVYNEHTLTTTSFFESFYSLQEGYNVISKDWSTGIQKFIE